MAEDLILSDSDGTTGSEISDEAVLTMELSSTTLTLRICFLKCIFPRTGFDLRGKDTGAGAVWVSPTVGVFVSTLLVSSLCPARSGVGTGPACSAEECSLADLSGLGGARNTF